MVFNNTRRMKVDYSQIVSMYDVKKRTGLIDLWFLFLKNSARLVPLNAIRQLKKVLGSPSCKRNRNRYGIKGPVITRLIVGPLSGAQADAPEVA